MKNMTDYRIKVLGSIYLYQLQNVIDKITSTEMNKHFFHESWHDKPKRFKTINIPSIELCIEIEKIVESRDASSRNQIHNN